MSAQQVAELRKRTGLSIKECAAALLIASGDIDRAVKILEERNKNVSTRTVERLTAAGLVEAYIHHNGQIGVIVELDCETDFVAKHEDFKKLAKDIAMHVASMNSKYVSADDIEKEVKETVFAKFRVQALGEKRVEEIAGRIAEGRLKKWISEVALLEQPFVKDSTITVQQYVNQAIGKFGENIKIRRFVRFAVKE